MKNIGIYSGTFDPIHQGHTDFAKNAANQFGLDKVFLLVEPRPRRKQGVKAYDHRFSMVKLAIKNETLLGAIRLEQARFTLRETLPVLTARFKGSNLYMLMGDDMLDHLTEWPDVDELIHTINIIIAARKRSLKEVKQLISALEETRRLKLNYQVMSTTKPDFSSSSIKRSIRHRQKPAGLNPSVYKYIEQHKLYTNQVE